MEVEKEKLLNEHEKMKEDIQRLSFEVDELKSKND